MRLSTLFSWFTASSRRRQQERRHRRQPPCGRIQRRLRLEPLEDRCLMAYAITDLGAWTAYGLNNNGQVVGTNGSVVIWQNGTTTINGSAVVWQNGTTTTIGSGTAVAINDAGEVAGYSSNLTSPRAFVWDVTHGLTNLGGLPNNYIYSQANDLNESGQVVGAAKWSYDPYDDTHAFLWDSTSGMQALQSFSTFNTATAINEAGQIVGWSQYSTGNGQYQSSQAAFFRDSNGATTLLGALPGWPFGQA